MNSSPAPTNPPMPDRPNFPLSPDDRRIAAREDEYAAYLAAALNHRD